MTTLTRPIRREVQAHYHKPIIVEIDPERGLGFREKGARKTFYLPIMTAYRMAILSEERKGG
jgi:hypothetical protein